MRFSWTAPHTPTPTPPCCRVEEACSHWCLQRESCPQPLPFLAGVPAQKWWGGVGSGEFGEPHSQSSGRNQQMGCL